MDYNSVIVHECIMIRMEREGKLYPTRYFTCGFWFLLPNWPEAVTIHGGSVLNDK